MEGEDPFGLFSSSNMLGCYRKIAI